MNYTDWKDATGWERIMTAANNSEQNRFRPPQLSRYDCKI